MFLQSKINKRLDVIGINVINKKINVFEFKDMLNKSFADMGVKVTVKKIKI